MKISKDGNAKEYFSSSFTNFMTDMTLFINPHIHTSQQNSVAERKNCHCSHIAYYKKVPQYFWSDAVLTSCYLITRISSVLHNQIMYSVLCPQNDLSSLPPKDFWVFVFCSEQ